VRLESSMRIKYNYVVSAVCMTFLCALVVVSAPVTRAQEPEGNFGVGVPEVFLPKYLAFRNAQLASGTPDVMRVKLGYVKGLSKSFIKMVGEAAINLESGAVSVNLSGLTPLQTYTLWLVDTASDPLAPDVTASLITFLASGPAALLNGVLPPLLPSNFTIDRVVVTEGTLFGAPLAAGTVNVFQKAFFRRLSLRHESSDLLLFDETTAAPALFNRVPALEFETTMAPLAPLGREAAVEFATGSGSSGRAVKLDKLVSAGAQLFFQETFAGNGRTCGTCHPSSNNFMIDKDFIATRPANDPLFVAEFNPALADLERPQLMRSFGLILENLDGFTPSTRFVMRGVPHTLGMQVSLTRDPTQTPTPAEMTGWSGDGSPGTGSLREFAIGAVTQHFTKRLNRVANVDFKLPTDKQLDAMEAFQLSLGRNADFTLAQITFKNAAVESGKNLFINGTQSPSAGGTCVACHNNGGALTPTGPNGNFNTNVEDVDHPARSILDFPRDGGFGRTPVNPDGSIGNRAFNTAPVVEAADTPPFFHNNVVATLEGVMDFYTGPEFNNPNRPAAFRFAFNPTQKNQITAFMRALNTLQNIDVASRELKEILDNRNDPLSEQATRLQTAFEDTDDGIDVLTEGNIFLSARDRLIEARNLISLAQSDPGNRRTLVSQAIAKLAQARGIVA
jgi:mono/diheme cytochrome c family protein